MACVHVLQNPTIQKFVDELLHEDHADPVRSIVVVSEDPPSPYLQLLLDSDSYREHMFFVRGSPLIEHVRSLLSWPSCL